MNNSNENTMVPVKVASKELNVAKGKIKDLMKENLIDWKLENGIYLVDINSIKEKDTFNNLVVIPKLIKKILSETYKDFLVSPNLRNSTAFKVFKRLSKSNSLNMMEAMEIFEYIFSTAAYFQATEKINHNKLLYNSSSEYQIIYTEAQRRFKINKYDKSVVPAEHFILMCFIKSNFNIISCLDTEFEWLNKSFNSQKSFF